MKMRVLNFAAMALFAGSPVLAQITSAVPGAEGWVIGPIIRGKNYSEGVPLHPTPGRAKLWSIDIPQAPGSAHYVTFAHGSLVGKSRITIRYRLETAPGVRVVAKSDPSSPGIITPYFQRTGDNWTGRGQFESYRWYGTFATQQLVPGEHTIIAPLTSNWTAVEASSSRTNPAAFSDAVGNAGQVGFVLGGGNGYGHGVFATGPARLTILDFRVE